MIRTSLINGVINLDSDFSKYIESLSNPGVIEGFNVQDGVVKPGKARVKAERTNGETIYCYVENTEDVSLSGNDGKVYIVINQEDIDSGLVSEDGSNIARIEEGDVRPEKNFLKIWSKNGGLIVDEREMVKKINEVDEDLEEEISGIDTRLTEAEHDIHQIIEQSGSALSYLDTTCYAGEEIHDNDLIVTNGNSFNPDRADESTDVGGQTVNKYAIGFIGNGEVTNCFQIKTGIIEGVTPDSVTVSIETDDNGKPSGTAVATADITDIIDNSLVSSTLRQIDGLTTIGSMTLTLYRLSCFAKHNYLDGFCIFSTNRVLNYTKVSQGFYPGYYNNDTEYDIYGYYDEQGKSISFSSAPTCKCISADVIALYGTIAGNIKTCFFRIKGDKFVNIKAVSDAYCSYINGISNDGKIMTVGGTSSGKYANVKLYVCETPYDFENATIYDTGIAYSSSGTYYVHLIEDIDGEKYIMHSRGNTHNIYKINSDYTVTKINENAMSYPLGRFDCGISDGVVTLVRYTYTSSSSKTVFYRHKFTGNPYYGGTTKNVWIDSVVSGKEKLRLVIEPTITGSVVDSIKVYDKEGEYYSECAVRDLNGWSNISNKTPYIATNCVKARYARKVNKTDDGTLGGFSNGDFTELEPVQYTFQGLKTGFSGLIADTLYYSDGYGGITTKKDLFQVGVSTTPNSILMKPIQTEKTTWSEYFKNSTGSPKSIYRYMLGDGRINFKGAGVVKAYTNGGTATTLVNSNVTDTATYSFSKGDVVKIVYERYETSSSYMTLSYTVN